MSNLIKINRAQRLYVLSCGNGYVSCLGYDVAERRRVAVLEWLGDTPEAMRKGSKRHYAAYQDAMTRGQAYAKETGKRCPAELTPQLSWLEGRRVEVVDTYGERRRFQVGKSCGWMPCHLEIARRDSMGGGAVTGAPFKSVQIVR